MLCISQLIETPAGPEQAPVLGHPRQAGQGDPVRAELRRAREPALPRLSGSAGEFAQPSLNRYRFLVSIGQTRRHDYARRRIRSRPQSTQTARHGRRRCCGGFPQQTRSRRGRTHSGGYCHDASSRWTPFAVRRGCRVGNSSLLAHTATRGSPPGSARAYGWRAQTNRRGPAGQLYRCEVRPDRLRLSCEDRPAAGRFRLSLWRAARRRRARVRHVPHRPAGARALHLYQLRRSGDADPGPQIRPAAGGDAPPTHPM